MTENLWVVVTIAPSSVILHLPIGCVRGLEPAWRPLRSQYYLTLTLLLFSFPGLQQKDLSVKRNFFPIAPKSMGSVNLSQFWKCVSSWWRLKRLLPELPEVWVCPVNIGYPCYQRDQKSLQRSHAINLAACSFPPSHGGRWTWERRRGGCCWARSICTGYWLGSNPHCTQINTKGGW